MASSTDVQFRKNAYSRSKSARVCQKMSDARVELLVENLLRDFPIDISISMELGVLRAATVPPICEIFLNAGGYVKHTANRHGSALAMVDTLMRTGWQSQESQRLISLCSQVHEVHDVPEEFLLYAFALMVAEPIRWCRQYGWRELASEEEQALGIFWTRVAEQLSLSSPAESTEEWIKMGQGFESHFGKGNENSFRISRIGREIFANRFWRPFRPMVRIFFVAMLDDKLRSTLGFHKPPAIVQYSSIFILTLRKWLIRRFPSMRSYGAFAMSKQVAPFSVVECQR